MKSEKSLVDLCLGSPTKIRVLSMLSAWRGKDLTELQLASLVGLSDFGVRHALVDLAQAGIVVKKSVGKANVWDLNESSYAYTYVGPIVEQIRKIPTPLNFVKDLILSIPKDNIEKIILFGSSVRLAFQKIGDIDVAVILKRKLAVPQKEKQAVEEALDRVAGLIGVKLGKRIEPHVFASQEWERMRGKTLRTNIEKGEEVYPHEKS